MFRSFVIGPVGTGRFGLIRRCVECRVRGATPDATCRGFGSGCLVSRPREEKEDRHGFTCAPLLDIDSRPGGN
jgi:hypothetical protein